MADHASSVNVVNFRPNIKIIKSQLKRDPLFLIKLKRGGFN